MIRLTRTQIREVDRLSIEKYHIPGIVLMEHAAIAVTREALAMSDGPFTILCGGGNNGGDGLAVARLLHNAEKTVQVLLAVDPTKYQGDALINWKIVQAMNLPCRAAAVEILVNVKGLLIDALFGTGLSKAPRDGEARLIDAVNRSGIPVLSVDIPSGLDCDTGLPPGACVTAGKTVTFAAEKIGFAHEESKRYTGDLIVAGIGCPREVIEEAMTTMP